MAGPTRRFGAKGKSDDDALEAEVRRLVRANRELEILNDLAVAIGRARSFEDTIGKIVRRTRHAVDAEEADLKLVEPAEHAPAADPMQTLVRDRDSRIGGDVVALDKRLLLGMMQARRRPYLSNNPANDPAVREFCRERNVRSLLLAPLLVKNEMTGILMAFNKKGEDGFSEDDQRLLGIMASQSAQLIETARLVEQERQFTAVREQLRLAREIQLGLLPRGAPTIPGYDVAGVSIPAQEVGGDYFDFIPTPDGCWAFCLGDVSGKGLPASLLMANLQATLRGQVRFNPGAEECVVWSNRLLYQCTDPEKFATLFYGVLDPARHELHYCNAGHERPLLLRAADGPPEELAAGGIVLGVLDDFPYQASTVRLEPGDLLVVYSDGVTDADDERERPFGRDRLLATIAAGQGRPAAELVAAIVEAVRAHARSAPQTDDVTLVVLRRTG